MVETVAWRPGYPARIDVQTAYRALERIRARQHGRVTASDVVEAARSPNSPLHDVFDWDDAKAAHEHRLAQARGMIGAIEVTYVERPAQPVRNYQIVTLERPNTPQNRVYTSTEDAMSDPVLRQQVLARAKVELDSFRRRYASLRELAHVFEAIDQTLGAA